jgi:hypothetical protein
MNSPTTPAPSPADPKRSEKATHLAERPVGAYADRTPQLRVAGWICGAVIFGAPIAQLAWEFGGGKPLQELDSLAPFTRGREGPTAGRWIADFTDDLTDEPRLRRFEDDLHDASFVKHEALPWYQATLTGLFGHGNEKAIAGRDGWLFFADDLKSAYGKGYLADGLGGQEALAAIADTKRQLDARGIALLLIPSYSKEMLDADRLSRTTEGIRSAVNSDLERFYAELDRGGFDYVRMDQIFAACRAAQPDPAAPLALARDSHWSPPTMAFCAGRIAERARTLLGELPADARRLAKRSLPFEGQGDLLRMLGLPAGQTLYPPMALTLEQIIDPATGEIVRSDAKSDVLLMGDSLTAVFSDPTLAMGEGAGLGEHLAFHLDRALDVIAIPGGSASATRVTLARREGDGLAGKKLVIWQFGVRMLASGRDAWKIVKLPEPGAGVAAGGAVKTGPALPVIGQPIGSKGKTSDQIRTPDYVPPDNIPTDRVTLVGEITAVSKIPPDFDYPFTLVVHECRVLRILDGKLPPKQPEGKVWVAFLGRVEGEDVAPSRYTPGMRFEMVLEDERLRFDENVSWQLEMDAGRIIHYPLTWKETKQ